MKTNHWVSSLIKIILFLSFLSGIGFCIYMITLPQLSNRENGLIGVLLTLFSILASWFLTHYYSESQHKNAIQEVQEQHKSNLRTYALKASEKVNNLSNELNKLSVYLDQELKYSDYSSSEEALSAKEERIESAIHIVKTLKSINDTSLSDWEGIIGEELDQQREEREEKEEALKTTIERYEKLIEDQRNDINILSSSQEVRHEVNILKSDLRQALSQLSEMPLPKKTSTRQQKILVQNKCPTCSNPIQYRQRPLPTSIRSMSCKNCNSKLFSIYDGDEGFKLRARNVVAVPAKCIQCENDISVPLDTYPGSSTIIICQKCRTFLRVNRTRDNVQVKIEPKEETSEKVIDKSIPSEEIIEIVKSKLTAQPWPKGIHKIIADDLGISHGVVSNAIFELIYHRKEYLPQIDGVVYSPKESK
jgi:hypothetical protein